jgi:hypothetical protein
MDTACERKVYDIDTTIVVNFVDGSVKQERYTTKAISYEGYLDSGNYFIVKFLLDVVLILSCGTRKHYIAKNFIHCQTEIFHNNIIVNEENFDQIMKNQDSSKIIEFQVKVFVVKPSEGGWNRFIPKEVREQYYSPLDE